MKSPITYQALAARQRELCQSFRFIRSQTVGRSYFTRPIDALSLGWGKKTLVMTGAHHGSEHLTAALLLDFAEELATVVEAGDRRFALDLRSLLEGRRLILLPIVNPDGVSLTTEGITADVPSAERLLRLNHGNPDFSRWQANARGVDLNHNYDYRFNAYKVLEKERHVSEGPTRYAGEYPESESETRAVCRLVREHFDALAAVFSFHSQGEVIYYHDTPNTRHAAAFLSRTSGYALEEATGLASYGGLTDWLFSLGVPAFTLEIGKGRNPLPDSLSPLLYATLRETLFRSLAFF